MENRETDLLLRESSAVRPKWNVPDSVHVFMLGSRRGEMRGKSGITVSIDVWGKGRGSGERVESISWGAGNRG